MAQCSVQCVVTLIDTCSLGESNIIATCNCGCCCCDSCCKVGAVVVVGVETVSETLDETVKRRDESSVRKLRGVVWVQNN